MPAVSFAVMVFVLELPLVTVIAPELESEYCIGVTMIVTNTECLRVPLVPVTFTT